MVAERGAAFGGLSAEPERHRWRAYRLRWLKLGCPACVNHARHGTAFSAGVLLSGGYNLVTRSPEIDDFNYTPRVKTPTWSINGRYDFPFPLETSAVPMFERLGTSRDRKAQVIVDAGHAIWSGGTRGVMTSRTLDWLDRYLGPVTMKQGQQSP